MTVVSYTVVVMSAQGSEPPAGAEAPSEEELQRRLEEQMRKRPRPGPAAESVVSILNLASRRIAKEDERDLEQARVGIEAVRGLVDLLDEAPREQVRKALSQVQMLYARRPRGRWGAGEAGARPRAANPRSRRRDRGPGGPEPPPRLWTPGSSNAGSGRSTVPAASRPGVSRPLLTD